MKLDNLQLIVLPGSPAPNFTNWITYQKGYDYYKATWERIFNRPKKPPQYSAEGYRRQSYIFQLMKNEKVIGQSCATHYPVGFSISKDLPYLQSYQGPALDSLEHQGCKNLLSLEYTSVLREYSTRKLNGLNLYKVLIYSSIKFGLELNIDGFLGLPRRVTNTTPLLTDIGFQIYSEQMDKYGVTVDVCAALRSEVKPYDDKEAMNLAEKIYMNINDTTGASSSELFKLPTRKAA
jgi:hypothetical protein